MAGSFIHRDRKGSRQEQPVSNRPTRITLQQAARDGNEAVVDEWISQPRKCDLDALDADGYAAMHYAAKFNRLKIIKLLGFNGADPAVKTRDEQLTPLHFAARYIPIRDTPQQEHEHDNTHLSSSRKAMEYLVTECKKVDVNCKDKCDVTPLHLACSRGNVAAVEVLLSSPKIKMDASDNNEDTPLHEACIAGDEDIVEMLLQRMKSTDTLLLENDEHQTPLHLACNEGHTKIVNLILEYVSKMLDESDPVNPSGLDLMNKLVTAKDNEHNTPLHLACNSGEDEIVKTLLENGADVRAVKDGDITPLHIAARHGFKKVAKILLEKASEKKCNIICAVDVHQRTPLHFAAESNQHKMITYLLDKGADIHALDKGSRTPLLTAAAAGQTVACKTLMDRRATIDVVDKDGRSAVFLAAEDDHVLTLEALLANEIGAKLCRTTDSHHNTPLHIAALKGNVSATKVLLQCHIKVDAKNELNKTPIHLAAEQGHDEIVGLVLKHQHDTILDEDEDSNTPLHLACTRGHLGVAKTLVDANANVEAKNANLWTPMHCAAAGGHEKLIELLIEAGAEVNAFSHKSKAIPLYLACKEGHQKVVEVLVKNGADVTKTDDHKSNALDLAIDSGHIAVAMTIIKSDKWDAALKNVTSAKKGEQTTPLRKLIRKMPKVAEEVFNRCIEPEDDAIPPSSPEYKVTFNYEFLEDFSDPTKDSSYQVEHDALSVRNDYSPVPGMAEPKGMSRTLLCSGTWCTSNFEKKNHPLAIMVESERVDLLKHPLVTSLLRDKWQTYGFIIYFANLFIYLIFLAFLTTFALSVPNPQSCTTGWIAQPNVTEASLGCDRLLTDHQARTVYAAALVIIVFAVIRLMMEVFQMIQRRLVYYVRDWVNWMEMTLFILSIIFAWVFHTHCLCEKKWQWQLGIVAVFLAWIDLVVFIRKLPLVGIYVVLFIDIFKIFLKMIFLSILLVVAFGLAFYMAFFEPGILRTPFATPARAIFNTISMTTGEFPFDMLFRTVAGGTEEDNSLEEIPFPPISYILWVLFIIMMPILLNNLLVGLAVDDIKGTLMKAVLKRYALQVEMLLNVDELFPCLRHYYQICKDVRPTVNPNKALSPWKRFKYKLWGTEQHDSAESIHEALHPVVEPIQQFRHDLAQDMYRMQQRNEDMQKTINELAKRNRGMEVLIRKLAEERGIITYI